MRILKYLPLILWLCNPTFAEFPPNSEAVIMVLVKIYVQPAKCHYLRLPTIFRASFWNASNYLRVITCSERLTSVRAFYHKRMNTFRIALQIMLIEFHGYCGFESQLIIPFIENLFAKCRDFPKRGFPIDEVNFGHMAFRADINEAAWIRYLWDYVKPICCVDPPIGLHNMFSLDHWGKKLICFTDRKFVF